MTAKIVNIYIPECEQLPEIVSSFTPEENYLMLKIGSECLKEGRKAVSTMTQKEIYNKLKEETKKDIEKLEMDLLVQERSYNKSEERIRNVYEIQLDKMKKETEYLQNQILKFTTDSNLLVHPELEKKDVVINEKEKLIKSLTEISERLAKQNETKSSSQLGDEGEFAFEKLANTFRDFQNYKIINKSQIGYKGDYHLFFKDFNVLVDAKNYSKNVYSQELNKIESDLLTNNTMDFAWLISLKTNFGDWNKFPIMYKWILTETGIKCIIIVNNLLSATNPEDTLRTVWAITNELNNLLKKTKLEDEDVRLIKERNYNLVQQIKSTQKKMVDLKRCITSMLQTVREIDKDLIDALSLLTNDVIKEEFNKYDKIKEWWDKNIKYDETNKEEVLLSTDIWNRLKKNNKECIDENNITIDDLKNYIKNYIENDKYNEKSKKGAYELFGFKFVSLIKNKKTKMPKLDNIIINNKNNDENIVDENILD
jgi:hypothetical protein